MNSLYAKESYLEQKKKAKLWLIFSICIFAFSLTFLGLSALFIKPNTVKAVTIIDSVVVSIGMVIAAFLFIEKFLAIHSRNKFVYRLLTVERFKGKITIIKIKESYLVKKNIKAHEIEAKDEDDKVVNYYYEDGLPLSFKEGDTINVITAANFIVEIEDIKDE